MRLSDNEVTVREFCKEDIDNKVKWINDPENNQYLHYDIPITYEGTLNWFNSKSRINRLDCVIEYTGIPVGLIGLLSIDHNSRKAEFYISMGDTSFKRKGIATRAINLILEYAFGDLNLNKVYLNVDEENIPACKLYEKTGFVCEGLFLQDLMHHGRLVNRKRYAKFAK